MDEDWFEFEPKWPWILLGIIIIFLTGLAIWSQL